MGDAYDNALAETVIGLYKTEVIHRRGPWRGFEDVKYATLEWVAWFNTRRLLGPLGYVSPAEYEEMLYGSQRAVSAEPALNQPSVRQTRGGSGAPPDCRIIELFLQEAPNKRGIRRCP